MSEAGEPLRTAPQPRARRVWSFSLRGLFILACLYTLSAARELLMPLAVGVLLYFLLMPAVRALKGVGIPESVGAAVIVGGLMVTVGLGLYALSWPAASWMARAPDSLRRVESKVRPLVRRIQKVTQTAEQMEKITTGPAVAPEVKVKEPGLGAAFLGGMQSIATAALIVLTLLYFLLASGDEFLRKIIKALPSLQDRKRAVDIARQMERQISSYLFLLTLVNLGFGIVVGVAMWLLGMPNAILWGVVAAVTNFVPYLGAIVCTVVIALAAILTFEDPWHAAAVPTVFFLLNTLEGYLVTPLLMGRRFTLNSAVLFVGLLFWWFVWGPPGVLLAVPMMAAFKIVCERVDRLQPLAAFMGEEEPGAGAALLEETAPAPARTEESLS